MPHSIYYNKVPVAVISEKGALSFDKEGIDRSKMPPQWIPHIKRLLENALPEGLRRDTLVRLAARNGAKPSDAVELVPYVADLPGRFSVGDSLLPEGKNEKIRDFSPLPETIEDASIASRLPDEFFDPLSETRVGTKPSFSGYQDKFTATMKTERGGLAIYPVDQDVERGNVIVKPSHLKYPFIAENEYLCLELAGRAGLSVPRAFLFRQALRNFPRQHLAIERFDVQMMDGVPQVLNVSEFAPLMGLSSGQKYETTTERLFEHAQSTLPAGESKKFASSYMFGCIVRNGDMHSKNFSAIFEGDSARFAPVYDMVNTEVYGDYSALALTLQGSNSPKTEDLIRFMLDYLSEDEICRIARSVKENLGKCADKAFACASGNDMPKFRKRLEQSISGGASRTLNALDRIKNRNIPVLAATKLMNQRGK